MKTVNEVLDEFDGQLTYQDIRSMTYKELGYLRLHRNELKKIKNARMKDSMNK